MLKITVVSDYVCPYCFLAEQLLLRLLEGKEAEIEWIPFELRPYPTPTLHPEGDYLQNVWRDSVYPLAQSLKVPISLPKVSPQPYTDLAFEGFQFAKEHGLANAYNHRMFTAFFREDKNIGNIEVLTSLAKEIGLPEEEFLEILQSRKYKEKHQKELEKARKMKIVEVPTLIIGDHVLRGLPKEDYLRRLIVEKA